MATDKSSSNTISQTNPDPYTTKRGIHETQVSMKNLILLFLNIILYFSSSNRSTLTCWQGSLIVSHLWVHKVHYDTSALLSSTKSWIYDKDERDPVKLTVSFKYTKDSSTFLFEFAVLIIFHSWVLQVQLESMYVQVVSK